MERDFYKELFLFDFFSTLFFLIKKPSLFFQEVVNDDYRKKSKPVTFFILSLSFFSIITLWTGNITTQSTWADIDFNELSQGEILTFLTTFSISSSDTKDFNMQILDELKKPCMSHSIISEKIRKAVGSCKLEDIANYFSMKNNSISSKLYQKTIKDSERNQKIEFIFNMLTPIGLIIFSFVFHKITNKGNIINITQAKSIMAYYLGLSLFFYTIMIGYMTTNTDLINSSETLSIMNIMQLLSLVIMLSIPIYILYITIYVIGKKIYQASLIRSFFAFFIASFFLNITSFFLSAIILFF